MKARWFVKGDLDGFFGLFIDNLLQILLIVALGGALCGFSSELIVQRILPAAAISVVFGNLFYSWQARRLAMATGRSDVTALPYGINTPSLVTFLFVVMAPVYQQTGDADLAWRVGLFACVISGLVEFSGAFVADYLRRWTPRAALLSALAGIAITFISMGFILHIFSSPLIAIVPMFLILVAYAGKVRFPLGLPGGLVAIGAGTLLAWLLKWAGIAEPFASPNETLLGFFPPSPIFGEVIGTFSDPRAVAFLPVIIPIGLINVIGSLQNLESAEAAGDRYSTRSSLAVNGLGTLAAAFFGSPFPTTIYIGHPGWKALGARVGYSVLNAVAITLLCLCGGVLLVLKFVPLEVTLGILLWIGIVIMAQAFQAVPKQHALAVAFGLIPSLGAWAFLLVETTVQASGSSLLEVTPKFGTALFIHGIYALNQGFLISATIFAAAAVFIIERRFAVAALWMGLAALFSALGLIHAYELTPAGLAPRFGIWAAPEFAISYATVALLLSLLAYSRR